MCAFTHFSLYASYAVAWNSWYDLELTANRDRYELLVRRLDEQDESPWVSVLKTRSERQVGGTIGVFSSSGAPSTVVVDLTWTPEPCLSMPTHRTIPAPPLPPKCSYWTEDFSSGNAKDTWRTGGDKGTWMYASQLFGQDKVLLQTNDALSRVLLGERKGCSAAGTFSFAYYAPGCDSEGAEVSAVLFAAENRGGLVLSLTNSGLKYKFGSVNGSSGRLYLQTDAWTEVAVELGKPDGVGLPQYMSICQSSASRQLHPHT